MHITHYCYEADTHCPACAAKRFGSPMHADNATDSTGVPHDAIDGEGNPMRGVMNIEETAAELSEKDGGHALTCGTCRALIREHFNPKTEN